MPKTSLTSWLFAWFAMAMWIGALTALVLFALHSRAAEPARNRSSVEKPVVVSPLSLGQVDADLVYTPIPPCRVFDTRASAGGAGPLVVGVARDFRTRGDLASQGGAAAGCGIPLFAAAVQLQMSPVFPAGFGWITGNAQGQPIISTAALFTYNTGDLNTASIAMVLNQTNAQFSIQANNTGIELIGDAVGYFKNSGANNSATGLHATVAGGVGNTATLAYATVGGGIINTASGYGSTVSGGDSNRTGGPWATVVGGVQNTASASAATVAGGGRNNATGNNAFVAGGTDNTAAGQWSFAGGRQAIVDPGHDGAFVWGGSNPFDFHTKFSNEFAVRATGGVRFVTEIAPANGAISREVSITTDGALDFGSVTRQNINLWGGASGYGIGVQPNTHYFRTGLNFCWFKGGAHVDQTCTPGAGGSTLMRLTPSELVVNGTILSGSDRNSKENFQQISARAILDKVVSLPLSIWNYKGDASKSVHLGPMAQDFRRLFELGQDDKTISTTDVSGVALAAIQGLQQLVDEKSARINSLEREVEAIKRKLGL